MKKAITIIISIALTFCLFGCQNSTKADKVIYGNIYTADESCKYAEAIAIKDGKFIYVGDKAGAEKFVGENTDVETFEDNQLITPGLVDGHTHIATLMIGQQNSLGHISQGANKETCIEEIADYVNNNPNLGFYTLTGWEMQNFQDEEYGCPTADMLDDITDKPILALTSDGHTYWVNNVLMNLAGVTKDTVSADGGVIVHDDNGEPLGIFKDTAQYVIDDVRPEKSKEIYYSGIQTADQVCAGEGYVYRFQAFDNEAFNSWKYPTIEYMEEMDKNGELKTYTQSSFVINNTDDALELVDEAIKLKEETAGGNFELTTVKIFLDGIVENAGAYLSEPYNEDGVGTSDYYGTRRWKNDEAIVKMGKVIAKANAAGMNVHFHCMGDQATSDALTAIEYAADEVGIDCVRENRNAIVHLALVKDSDYERFENLNVVAVFNPWCNKDPGYYDLQVSLLGKERADAQYPMKSFIDNGVHVSFGTDLGASFTYNSVECFHALTTRTYNNDDQNSLLCEEQKLSREETLDAMTIGGAYQLHKEDSFGSITVGKEASLSVFSKDILTIPDTEIMSTEVIKAMYQGNWLD